MGQLVGKPMAKGDELLVKQVLDEYLDWSEANHAKSTHKRVRASILSFAGESLPPALAIGELRTPSPDHWLDKRYPKRPKKDGSKAASDNTRHDIASDMLAAFNWAAGPTSGEFATRRCTATANRPRRPGCSTWPRSRWKTCSRGSRTRSFGTS